MWRPVELDKAERDFFDGLKREFDAALKQSQTWQTYSRNIKAFTYHVGCPNAYEEPTSNVRELRRLHATQMPFFHKLQEDLAEQVKRNERQQLIITCLVFRYLFEHLPNRNHPKDASLDWKTFWKDAYIKGSQPGTKGHPLEPLLNDGAKTFAAQLNSASNINNQKAYQTANGTVYEAGNGLYSVTSKNIHGFYGHEDKTMTIFNLKKDFWPKPYNDILEALSPKCFQGKGHDLEGEVDWDVERKRYL